ncbi:MAG: EamA family transporter [Desulfitobacteriaceae bacterium]|nr:EamA family transporter [Desulfitobacteriaceae bacterium]MDD4753787.1 EamA family transporter [Desulfitobacteriaceae bacterium]
MNVSLSVRAHIAVILAACMWGSIGVFVRTLDSYNYSALTIVFVRMIIAFALLFAYLCLFNKKDLLRIKIKDAWIFISAGLSSAVLLNLFYSMSIVANSLSLASVLLATAPFFVVFLSAPLFKEKITAVKITALLVAFIGCVLTSGFIGSGSTFNPFGILIGVLSGIGWAIYSIFSRFALNRGYDSLTISVYTFAIGSLSCIPFTNFGVIGTSIQGQPVFMLFLLFTHALIASLLPYILYTYGLNYVETGKAAIMSGIDPVTAVLLGAVIYAEIPSFTIAVGIVLVLLSIALLNLPRGFQTFIPGKAKN